MNPPDLATQLAAAQRRIAELEAAHEASAGFDPLTGLATAREFCARMEVELGRARRHDRPVSVALLDVDGMGDLVAAHGPAVGDRVLEGVGSILAAYLRAYDLACRTFEDEFAVLLPDTNLAGAFQCLGRIALELRLLDAGPLHGVPVSVGVATLDERAPTAMKLLGVAAQALDRSRASGGGAIKGPALAER
jgi:diguanylate cyclase (GGDEF)-like protein